MFWSTALDNVHMSLKHIYEKIFVYVPYEKYRENPFLKGYKLKMFLL